MPKIVEQHPRLVNFVAALMVGIEQRAPWALGYATDHLPTVEQMRIASRVRVFMRRDDGGLESLVCRCVGRIESANPDAFALLVKALADIPDADVSVHDLFVVPLACVSLAWPPEAEVQ
jgi:hypothetical protein